MKHQHMTFAVVAAALALGAFAGCYTKLMPFRDAVEVRRASVAHNSGGNFTSDLNYSENCLSCHSQAELNDRATDMDYAGIHTVHGIAYDPYGWQNPYTQPTWWDPNPPISIGVAGGSTLQPVLTKNPPTSQPTRSSNAERRRTTGSSRGTERTRDANPTGTVTPTMPSTPSSSPSTGQGAVKTPPATTTQTPAATQAPASSTDTRSRSGSSGESSTRKTGSGRQ